MSTRTKICPICGKSFSYEIGQGTDRVYCQSKECQLLRKRIQFRKRLLTYPKCRNPQCSNPATRIGSGYCETCYGRLRRTGNLNQRVPNYRYVTGAGYIKLYKPQHPLADSFGNVFEHRYVVYENHSGDTLSCFWCGQYLLSWDTIIIDHLNEDKQDNRAANLVISCNNCNRARGAFIPFVRRMRPEALDKLMECLVNLNRENQQTNTRGKGGVKYLQS